MLRSPVLPIVLLTIVPLLACGDQPDPAEPAPVHPAFRTEKNPDGRGAQVIRFAAQGIFISDSDRDVSMWIGVPISEAPECGGTGEATGADVQIVITPAEVEHIVARVRQATFTLYDHFTDDFCSLADADFVGRGLGNADLRILSKASGVLFQIQGVGTIELTAGGLAHVVAMGKFHIFPDGSLQIHVDKFDVHPVGG